MSTTFIDGDGANTCFMCCFAYADKGCREEAEGVNDCGCGDDGHYEIIDAGNTAISEGKSEVCAAVIAAQVCRECDNNKETV